MTREAIAGQDVWLEMFKRHQCYHKDVLILVDWL